MRDEALASASAVGFITGYLSSAIVWLQVLSLVIGCVAGSIVIYKHFFKKQ